MGQLGSLEVVRSVIYVISGIVQWSNVNTKMESKVRAEQRLDFLRCALRRIFAVNFANISARSRDRDLTWSKWN